MINAVTPEFVKACFMDIGPLNNLVNGTLSMNGFGRLFSKPLGYIIIRVQVEGMWGHSEDQVALVIPDPTDFGSKVPVILVTPTINQIINVIKESKIDELSVSLNLSRISYLSVYHWAELSFVKETAVSCTRDLTDLNESVKMTKMVAIDAFSSKIIHTWTKIMFLVSNMHVTTLALEDENGSLLPHRLIVINTYTEMATGSKNVSVIMGNLTAVLITITKGNKIVQVIAANAIPQVGVSPGMLEKLDEMQGIQKAKMSVKAGKGSTLPATGLLWPGGVLHQQSSHHMCSTSWIPWHLFLGTWGVRLHWSGKT